MQTELFKKMSKISYIIDYTEQINSYANGALDNDNPAELKLKTQITRNTNSIKAIIQKYLDILQKQCF